MRKGKKESGKIKLFKKRRTRFTITTGLIILILAASAFLLPGFTRQYIDPSLRETASSSGTDVAEAISQFDSLLAALKLPLLEGVPLNTYDTSCFSQAGDFISYNSDSIDALRGIDISYFQGDIDWDKVKAEGVEFVMIRAGYRGYGNGELCLDETFKDYVKGASEAGIDVGVYFFSQAITAQEAEEEANFLLDAIKDMDISYPVVFDWEEISYAEARTDDITTETLTECCRSFCEKIKAAGYTPMVYFNQQLALLGYDLRQLTDYTFWLAEYDSVPSFGYNFQMWQYSTEGSVDGIEGAVDLNLSFVDYSKN